MPRFKLYSSFTERVSNRSSRIILGLLGFVLVLVGFGGIGQPQFPVPFQENYAADALSSDSSRGGELTAKIKEFGLRIEKLGVLAPVVADVDGIQESVYGEALGRGAAHYRGTSLPGEGGNIFIFGHSGLTYDKGPYSTVFSHLEDLGWGDRIVVYYRGEEFEYSVFWERVIEIGDRSVLEPTSQEQLTLMTCWPVGDNKQRLVVKAQLVE